MFAFEASWGTWHNSQMTRGPRWKLNATQASDCWIQWMLHCHLVLIPVISKHVTVWRSEDTNLNVRCSTGPEMKMFEMLWSLNAITRTPYRTPLRANRQAENFIISFWHVRNVASQIWWWQSEKMWWKSEMKSLIFANNQALMWLMLYSTFLLILRDAAVIVD